MSNSSQLVNLSTSDFTSVCPKIDMFVNATTYEKNNLFRENKLHTDSVHWNWNEKGYQINVGSIDGHSELIVLIEIYIDKIGQYNVGFYKSASSTFDSHVM